MSAVPARPAPRTARLALVASGLGAAGVLAVHVLVFFRVPTEATMGVAQRIFYLHAPAAWVGTLAFVLMAAGGVGYLLRPDERLDALARSAAEGGLVFTSILLFSGPLWARVSWGTWWSWEPRFILALALWVIFVWYFLVRSSPGDRESARRWAAVVSLIGVANLLVLYATRGRWRSMHPDPVVLRRGGPRVETAMLVTVVTAFAAFTLLFLGLLLLRYRMERIAQGEGLDRSSRR